MTPSQYKAERTKRELSQKDLAALVGVSRITINAREAGRFPINKEAELSILSLPIETQSK